MGQARFETGWGDELREAFNHNSSNTTESCDPAQNLISEVARQLSVIEDRAGRIYAEGLRLMTCNGLQRAEEIFKDCMVCNSFVPKSACGMTADRTTTPLSPGIGATTSRDTDHSSRSRMPTVRIAEERPMNGAIRDFWEGGPVTIKEKAYPNANRCC